MFKSIFTRQITFNQLYKSTVYSRTLSSAQFFRNYTRNINDKEINITENARENSQTQLNNSNIHILQSGQKSAESELFKEKHGVLNEITSPENTLGFSNYKIKNFFKLFNNGDEKKYMIELNKDPKLSLVKGTIIHPNGRWIFHDISIVQYSFWSLDSKNHNIFKELLLEKNMQKEYALQLLEHTDEDNPPLYVQEYGLNFDFDPLLNAIENYIRRASSYSAKPSVIEKNVKIWCIGVKSFQNDLPRHVIQEYFKYNDRHLKHPNLFIPPEVAWAPSFNSLQWDSKFKCPVTPIKFEKSYGFFLMDTNISYTAKNDFQAYPNKQLALKTWRFLSNIKKLEIEQIQKFLHHGLSLATDVENSFISKTKSNFLIKPTTKEIQEYFKLLNKEKYGAALEELEKKPSLALERGSISHGNRIFEDITVLQFFWWALDLNNFTHVKEIMLDNKLNQEIKKQILENTSDAPLYIQQHGHHINLDLLIDTIENSVVIRENLYSFPEVKQSIGEFFTDGNEDDVEVYGTYSISRNEYVAMIQKIEKILLDFPSYIREKFNMPPVGHFKWPDNHDEQTISKIEIQSQKYAPSYVKFNLPKAERSLVKTASHEFHYSYTILPMVGITSDTAEGLIEYPARDVDMLDPLNITSALAYLKRKKHIAEKNKNLSIEYLEKEFRLFSYDWEMEINKINFYSEKCDWEINKIGFYSEKMASFIKKQHAALLSPTDVTRTYNILSLYYSNDLCINDELMYFGENMHRRLKSIENFELDNGTLHFIFNNGSGPYIFEKLLFDRCGFHKTGELDRYGPCHSQHS